MTGKAADETEGFHGYIGGGRFIPLEDVHTGDAGGVGYIRPMFQFLRHDDDHPQHCALCRSKDRDGWGSGWIELP